MLDEEVGNKDTEQKYASYDSKLKAFRYYDREERNFMDQAMEELNKGLLSKQRDEPYMPSVNMSNFISCFGSEPNTGVLAASCMIHDFRDTLQSRFDRQTLQVAFPQALDNMIGDR